MPKFIITQIDRYEIEADSLEEAQANYKVDMVEGWFDYYDYIDGSTTYTEIE